MRRTWVLFVVQLGVSVFGYNVAPEASLIASHVPDSYFGYTVALQDNLPRLIVGAPRGNSSLMGQTTQREPGVVFSFSIQGNSSNVQLLQKHQITLEAAGEKVSWEEKYRDRKEEAWIGGALDVSTAQQNLIACGSRWSNQFLDDHYLMNGVCYSLSDSRSLSKNAVKLLPLLDMRKQSVVIGGQGLFYYSYGQAGFSVHLTPDHQLMMGAPGVLAWLGSVVMYESTPNGTFKNPVIPNPSLTKKNLRYLAASLILGYAVSSGTFHKNRRLYVASAPRSLNVGKVIVFQFPTEENAPLEIEAELTGSQLGEYFGASICVADLDSDGLDDILVGAPFYAKKDSYDEGIVYVYYNAMIWDESLRYSPTKLKGKSIPGARFGSAISSIGDIDLDGYIDIAIGAPYENHGSSTGSIYIYKGSSEGLNGSPSQVIEASELNIPLRGFGISISRGLDVDGNRYPDFAVGAHESGHAVVFRTKPVVRIFTTMKFSVSTITENITEFTAEICLSYQGHFLTKSPLLVAEVTILADTLHHRVSVEPSENALVELISTSGNCHSFIIKLRQPSANWPPHIRFTKLSIVTISSLTSNCPICPILGLNSRNTITSDIPVMTPCAKEECIPEWKLSATFLDITDSFVVGSVNSLVVRIKISNVGENAHLKMLNVTLPTDVRLRTLSSDCESTENFNSWKCLCSVRVNHEEQISLDVILDVTAINSSIILIKFTAQSYGQNSTVDEVATVHAIREPVMDISGRSITDLLVVHNAVPLSITHSFFTYCSGFTPVTGALVDITVPSHVFVKESWLQFLTYVVEARIGDIAVNCTEVLRNVPCEHKSVPYSSEFDGNVDRGSSALECITIQCETTETFFPHEEGLNVDLKMDISREVLETLLDPDGTPKLELPTWVEVRAHDATSSVTKSLTTTLAGSMPERPNPYLWVYILVAVIIALMLLACLIYLLIKCGFFKRPKRPGYDDIDELQKHPKGEIEDEGISNPEHTE